MKNETTVFVLNNEIIRSWQNQEREQNHFTRTKEMLQVDLIVVVHINEFSVIFWRLAD